jgi:hypothetical protein
MGGILGGGRGDGNTKRIKNTKGIKKFELTNYDY